MDAKECLDKENHTPCPIGYLAWSAWAERMAKTHNHVKCKHCGCLAVWEPKLMFSLGKSGRRKLAGAMR